MQRDEDKRAVSQNTASAGIAVGPARYAAALAIVAGLIHLGVMPEHFEEAFEYGVFMLAIGAAQIVAGILWSDHMPTGGAPRGAPGWMNHEENRMRIAGAGYSAGTRCGRA